jgi:hypothetical protein
MRFLTRINSIKIKHILIISFLDISLKITKKSRQQNNNLWVVKQQN